MIFRKVTLGKNDWTKVTLGKVIEKYMYGAIDVAWPLFLLK